MAPAASHALLSKDIAACRLCPRLVEWRERAAREKTRRYAEGSGRPRRQGRLRQPGGVRPSRRRAQARGLLCLPGGPLRDGPPLPGTFHPSQQNTFTGRLTEAMLDGVFKRARALLAD